jgi:hypothetical protein
VADLILFFPESSVEKYLDAAIQLSAEETIHIFPKGIMNLQVVIFWRRFIFPDTLEFVISFSNLGFGSEGDFHICIVCF